jgi:hypothetical protein
MSRCQLIGESSIAFDYATQLNSKLRTNATCQGSASAPTRSCSFYGTARRNVAGPNGIQDPVLIQRSYNSSGSYRGGGGDGNDGGMTPLSGFARLEPWDTKPTPSPSGITSYMSRDAKDIKEVDRTPWVMYPKTWSNQYNGISQVNGFVPDRTIASCRASNRFKETKSTNSYGSYGVFGI